MGRVQALVSTLPYSEQMPPQRRPYATLHPGRLQNAVFLHNLPFLQEGGISPPSLTPLANLQDVATTISLKNCNVNKQLKIKNTFLPPACRGKRSKRALRPAWEAAHPSCSLPVPPSPLPRASPPKWTRLGPSAVYKTSGIAPRRTRQHSSLSFLRAI